MGARLSSITGRESQAIPRPNITSTSFSFGLALRRYSALQIDGKPLYKYVRDGKPLLHPIEARPVQVDHIALITFIPSVPIPGSGNKLPDLGHQYGFPVKTVCVEQQRERLKVLRLVN